MGRLHQASAPVGCPGTIRVLFSSLQQRHSQFIKSAGDINVRACMKEI